MGQRIAIDLKGPFVFSKSVVLSMIGRGGGKIINLTSGLGKMVMSPFGVHSIAKAGVNHLTRYMAEEPITYR